MKENSGRFLKAVASNAEKSVSC